MAAAIVTRELSLSPHFPAPPTAVMLLAPCLLISAAFLIVPLAVIFMNSLTEVTNGRAHFSFGNYIRILTDGYYWEVLLRTMRISLITTVAALVLGYPAALYLYFSNSRWRRVFLLVVVSPLFISVIVRTYGWIVLLSPNGALNALLPAGYQLKLHHTETAIVLGLMHIYLPIMVLSLNAALVKVDKRLLAAAASLGASNWRIFRDILVPPSLPGILAGCVIVFSIATTAFSTPVLLGGTVNKTMPYIIYQQNLLLSNWHLGSALAFVLLFVTLAIVRIFTRATERGSTQMVMQ